MTQGGNREKIASDREKGSRALAGVSKRGKFNVKLRECDGDGEAHPRRQCRNGMIFSHPFGRCASVAEASRDAGFEMRDCSSRYSYLAGVRAFDRLSLFKAGRVQFGRVRSPGFSRNPAEFRVNAELRTATRSRSPLRAFSCQLRRSPKRTGETSATPARRCLFVPPAISPPA